MTHYGNIYIESLTFKGMGGGEYFSDISKEHAQDVLKEIKDLTSEFVIANDCSVDIVEFNPSEKDKSMGFYILNRKELSLIRVFWYPNYEEKKEDFVQAFTEILSNCLDISNPAGLLRKTDKKEEEDFFSMMKEGRLR